MDPQQRLVLELAWEALEDAGIVPSAMRGDQAGVFLGAIAGDYSNLIYRSGSDAIGRHTMTGLHRGIIANRISYTLGLTGPSLTVDAAQSSSLVAVHLACESLRKGEAEFALAGGVHLNIDPRVALGASEFGGLSPDGRCFTFDARANGYVRGEGGGVVALKPLPAAAAAGDRIYCVIRGGAVNNDGPAEGLTVPSREAQESVLRQAYRRAGVKQADVQYVELHGTGTAVGDPIEAAALGSALGSVRSSEDPLPVGSAKTNVGHLEGAAGIVGLIKAALAIEYREIPASLNYTEPNPEIPLDALRLRVQDGHGAWPHDDRPLVAGVSSFGMGGTNCHLVIAEAPGVAAASPATEARATPMAREHTPTPQPLPGPTLLPISAKTEPALADAAERLAAHLRENPELDLTDVACSLATTRSAFEHRAVAVGAEREELLAMLTAYGRGEEQPAIARGRATAEGKAVFLFPGQGSQWGGMALGLLDTSPVFAAKLRECSEALQTHTGWSVEDVVRGAPDAPSLELIEVVQPALFAVTVALAGLWRSCGVHPAAVAGHSQGEIAAAYAAGALTLEDAARLVAVRCRLMAGLAGQGGLISVGLSADLLASRLAKWEGRIEVAAINGPFSTIASGEQGLLDELLAQCAGEGIRARDIPAAIASHSAYVEVLREEFLEEIVSTSPREGEIPFHSTVTGGLLDGAELDAEYWYRNMREPVRFEGVMRGLLEQGQRVLIEISPHPVLNLALQETIEDALSTPSDATVLGTLRRDEGGPERFALSLANAHAAGAKLDWRSLFEGTGAKRVALPTYPFQRKRYWLSASTNGGDPASIGLSDADHPLLGASIEDPQGEGLTLTGRLSLATHPWLADHAVAGTVLLPGTAFLELALRAGEQAGAESIQELTLQAPLILPPTGAVQIQVQVSGEEEGRREIAIHSRPDSEESEEWSCHAQGLLSAELTKAAEPLESWPPEGAEPIDVEDLYGRLEDLGLRYGPAFQGLSAAWRDGEQIYTEVSLPEEHAREAERFAIHPALLDGALHALLFSGEAQGAIELPFAWSGVSLQASGAASLRVALKREGEGTSLTLFGEDGAPFGTVSSLLTRALSPEQLGGGGQRSAGLLEIEWQKSALGEEISGPELTELSKDEEAEVPAVVLWRVGEAKDGEEATQSTLEVVQRWLAEERFADSRLALVTEGAVCVNGGESPALETAPIWGLLRSAQSEHPGRFTLIDTDGSEASEGALASALGTEEPQIALREGVGMAARARRLSVSEGEEQECPIDPQKTVLVTGGTGGLGALTARHLAEHHGARHLLLISRSGEKAKGARELKSELAELGAKTTIAACDVSDRKALQKLLAKIPDSHPLGAVFHAAGVLADGLLEQMGPGQIERVFAPKAKAAQNLHELSEDTEISAFVMFSSAAGALGAPGQANYAAANAYLDALAHHRSAKGLPATSIAWGLWQRESSMTAELGEADLARMKRAGIEALTDEQGLALLDQALLAERPAPIALRLNPAGLRSQAQAGLLPVLLSGLIRTSTRRKAATGSLATKLATLPEAEREPYVLELVRSEVATVLGHSSPAAIEPAKAFKDLGFDSLAAVELRNRINTATGLRLAATVVFNQPSSEALAAYLLAEATAGAAAKQITLRARSADEPIAIVGMSCRYPGAVSSPEQLWQLLAEGADGISEFPADRGWDLERLYDPDPESPGTSYAKEGGFLTEAGHFDAEFFGIAPREALAMDPQQRLLLEAAWEALEDAGIDPGSLRGEEAGVFAGIGAQDYTAGLAREKELEGYRLTGAATSVASGRIAYALGLEGPAITVDTACSSSLVAMHLASQALRGGECSLALAGGATVLASPGMFTEFSRQRGLAPDGRCKSFSEAADGVAWAEGAGMLILERLSDAERNNHPVLAVIKGSAVNQDGASNGLTAPNGPSQERVIRQALANANLSPKDVDAVEAHGTGTTLGDPIEAGALLATYGQDREEPLKLGSIKSNIGHAIAAAGVAGVIKMVAAMREGVLPKTLHVDAPSSKVEWGAGKIELLTEPHEWEPNGRPRRAGVSSFGISGTNAHLILEEAPVPSEAKVEEEAKAPAPLAGPLLLALSAKTEPALADAASRLATHLRQNPQLDPADVAYSLATTRSAFEHRAVAVGEGREQLLGCLDQLTRGAEDAALARGLATAPQSPVFLFPGQGSQFGGMAQELLAGSPAFAAHMGECEAALSPHVEWSLTEVLGEEEARWLDRLDVVQPALFAVMVSLAKLWRECGVEPAVLIGHSQGEIAAAHIAGALSLDDAALIIAKRGEAMAKIAGKGGMLSVSLSPQELAALIEPFGERVSLAAINGPASLVASGEPEALAELREACEKDGIRAQPIAVDYAAHSAQIEDLREELLDAFSPISPQSGEIAMHSTLTGELIDTAELNAEYWYRNLRETVRLEPVLRSQLEAGKRTLIEISPHPVLAFALEETIEDALTDPSEATVLATLRREEGSPERFALSLANAHAAGAKLDWRSLFEGTGAKRVALPTYPFQRKRYWLSASTNGGDPASIGLSDADHPLLGATIEDPRGEGLTLTGRLSLATHPWLADHALTGTVLLPGTAFLELALRAGEQAGTESVEELTLQAPLILPPTGAVQIQVQVSGEEEGRREIAIHSRPDTEESEEWTCHAQGLLSGKTPKAAQPLDAWPPEGAEPLDVEDLYERLSDLGLQYGPAFQGLLAAWRDGEQIYAEVSLPEEHAREAQRFAIHPALLDAALHAIALSREGEEGVELPFAWSGVSLEASGAASLRVALKSSGEGIALRLADQDGAALGTVSSLLTRALSPEQLGEPGAKERRLAGDRVARGRPR